MALALHNMYVFMLKSEIQDGFPHNKSMKKGIKSKLYINDGS